LVSRSTDGGRTWGPPVAVNKSGQFNDKNWTVCDDWTSSPLYGHCYTEFDDASNINLVQMSTSTDGGRTWGPSQTTADRACVIGGQPLVQPNGTVVVPIDDCYEGTLLAFRSTDGGQSWSRTVKAAQLLYTFNPGGIRSPTLPTAEVDGLGNVYVVWSDCRFEPPNCSTNDLVLSTSPDGLHWTLPKRIPIDPIGSGVDHLIPGLAVDRSTAGVSAHLGLTYYYFPNSNCAPSTCRLKVGFISSTNGGASWSAAQTVAGPMLMPWLANTNQGRMVGDYISTSIAPGADDATPAFAVAYPPTGDTDCGVDVVCHEATYTTPADLLPVLGGANAVSAEPTYAPAQQPALVRHTAN
jgi:hypothetical protein